MVNSHFLSYSFQTRTSTAEAYSTILAFTVELQNPGEYKRVKRPGSLIQFVPLRKGFLSSYTHLSNLWPIVLDFPRIICEQTNLNINQLLFSPSCNDVHLPHCIRLFPPNAAREQRALAVVLRLNLPVPFPPSFQPFAVAAAF